METKEYRNILSGETKPFKDWQTFADNNGAHISSLCPDSKDRLLVRKNTTSELIADLLIDRGNKNETTTTNQKSETC